MNYYDEDGEEITDLPRKWTICGGCSGNGRTSEHLGVINREDWDDEEFSDYMRGAYDKICTECDGSGKIQDVDMDRLTPEQQEMVIDQQRQEACYAAECEAERRMFC